MASAEEKERTPEMENSSEKAPEVSEMEILKLSGVGLPTMFGEIREKNVIFCVDTSGSMYNALDAVKEHLIQTLMRMASCDLPSHFNLIEFSTDVTQWSDKMVQCTPQTVAVAAQWVKELVPKTGTNTMEALLSALSDEQCEAVYMVTDGFPDQNPDDILDHVSYASQNRPVHCFYIQGGSPDAQSTKFLQDLAMETYGSFHIITVAQHGAVERITPIYRAEAAAERIVRTTDGNIVPSNHKVCSVATTLSADIPVVEAPLTVVYPGFYPSYYNYHLYPWPFCHYYRYSLPYTPSIGWSRFRPSKGWMKHTESIRCSGVSDLTTVPGPGAMLISTKVLARRHDDGLFYLGTVKTQMQDCKFLVEFGPCKHGKYRDTVYQETFVYDIVSYEDALRHSILVGDKVLAPWEPDGQRHGPGVVIQGQEKRYSEGGGPDEQIVVSFYNGKSATIPAGQAVWIPIALHERITFELQLPANVRKEFAQQEAYPQENRAGYPMSGPVATPVEYERHQPVRWQSQPGGAPEYTTAPFHVPLYPVYYKYQPKPSAVKSEEVDKIIPGTEMTKEQLNEKVMAQIMQHKMTLEERIELQQREMDKLLKLRETLQENTLDGTRKSVTFQNDSDLECELDTGELEMKDSGRGSTQGEEEQEQQTSEPEAEALPEPPEKRDAAVGTSARLFYKRRTKVPDRRPMWKYWGNESAPELIESNHYGPYRLGPYDQTAVAAPLELRKSRVLTDGGIEWNTSMTGYVDRFAKHRHDASVRDSLYLPKPPPTEKPEKQGPGQDISNVLGTPLREAQKIAEARRDFRRQQVERREQAWQQSLAEKDRMQAMMEDQHRVRVSQQLDRDQQRHRDEWQRLQNQREAKKLLNSEIRQRISENQEHEIAKQELRVEALRRNRQRRDDLREQRRQEIEQMRAKAQVAREERVQDRWNVIGQKMETEQAQNVARDNAARIAKLQRIYHFRELEREGQKQKWHNSQVSEQQRNLYRSYVLP